MDENQCVRSPLTNGGAEEESNGPTCLYSNEAYEPTFRTGQNAGSPSYYSTPYSGEKEEYPTSVTKSML